MVKSILNKTKIENNINEIIFFLFLLGYILEFLFRRGFLNADFKILSVLPFTANIVLLCFMLFKKNDSTQNRKKASRKYILGLAFNLGSILFIFFIWTKIF
ncbi:hypothetical protein DQ356_01840 [Chryseobacterium lacus]|uniref:Uncharacterized protein n=1 Tax=Chryseobacterium lacus TaxID=2058346 RepID=A0A368N5X4_9FLAO|nr:hypothetical protein DQ356_01840 [Chryseobacterium lacus]